MHAHLSRVLNKLAAPAAIALVIAAVAGAAILATTLSRLSEAAPPTGETDDFVVRKLKAAIMESESKLGNLDPWQKKILDEEAVPQYQRFIRDYRSAQTHSGTAASNLSVDIDIESLKNYLRFFAPKAYSATVELPILVSMRAGEDCGDKCIAAGPQLRGLVAARLARRGLKPVWISDNDRTTDRNAVGTLTVHWGKAPAEDADSAHADEEHYQIRMALDLKPIGGKPFHSESKLDLLANHTFTASFARLATDLFTELGARVAVVEKNAGKVADVADQTEIRLAVVGYRDFAQLAQVKAELQARLPDSAVYERKVSRGRATFVVAGDGVARALPKTISEIKASGIVGQAQMEIEQ